MASQNRDVGGNGSRTLAVPVLSLAAYLRGISSPLLPESRTVMGLSPWAGLAFRLAMFNLDIRYRFTPPTTPASLLTAEPTEAVFAVGGHSAQIGLALLFPGSR